MASGTLATASVRGGAASSSRQPRAFRRRSFASSRVSRLKICGHQQIDFRKPVNCLSIVYRCTYFTSPLRAITVRARAAAEDAGGGGAKAGAGAGADDIADTNLASEVDITFVLPGPQGVEEDDVKEVGKTGRESRRRNKHESATGRANALLHHHHKSLHRIVLSQLYHPPQSSATPKDVR